MSRVSLAKQRLWNDSIRDLAFSRAGYSVKEVMDGLHSRLAFRELSYIDRLSMNSQIRLNKYLCYPVVDDWTDCFQNGRGQVTDFDWCGRHVSVWICRDGHDGVTFHGEDFSGKDAVVHQHRWCGKPECPICYLNGFASEGARAIWAKLSAGVAKGYGAVEHFQVSFSAVEVEEVRRNFPKSWVEVMRKRAVDACLRRDILGAALMVHFRRIDRVNRTLKKGLHFHGLGFCGGGYDICRGCSWLVRDKRRSCWCACEDECKGFEQRTRRAFEKDGVIVKVFGKRGAGRTEEEAVIRTAKYVLSHAGFQRVEGRRFYEISYFGCCANKRLRSLKVPRVNNCPVCASVGKVSPMVKAHYVGSGFIVRDIGDVNYQKVFSSSKVNEWGSSDFLDSEGDGG
jgi:hypothetical protein